jgi:hypothetical protein
MDQSQSAFAHKVRKWSATSYLSIRALHSMDLSSVEAAVNFEGGHLPEPCHHNEGSTPHRAHAWRDSSASTADATY